MPLLRNYFDHRRQTLCERAILTLKVPHWIVHILFSLPYSSLLFLSTCSSEYSPLYAKFSIISCPVRFHSPSGLLTTVPTHFRFQNQRIAGLSAKFKNSHRKNLVDREIALYSVRNHELLWEVPDEKRVSSFNFCFR